MRKRASHRLVSVDRAAGRMVCAACGDVDVVWKKDGGGHVRPRCAIAIAEQRQRPTTEAEKAAHYARRREVRAARRAAAGLPPRATSPPREPHGLTRAEARERVAGAPCEICGRDAEHVDHDHETGALRGVLCRTCNLGIGQLRDDPRLLRAAAAYLERYALTTQKSAPASA